MQEMQTQLRKFILPISSEIENLFQNIEENALKSDKMYPPYNIYKADDNHYIEIAVTGLSKDDIKAYNEDGYLIVEGTYPEEEREYYSHTLSRKNFKRKFVLKQYWEVKDIIVKNGLCSIEIYENKPETNYIEIK